MAELTLDAEQAAREAIVEIKLLNLNRFRIRTSLAFALLRLAHWIAPFELVLHKELSQAWLWYCPHCGHDNFGYFLPGQRFTILCGHCNRQSLADSTEDGCRVVKEPEACDCGCGFQEPYGFVSGAGCPIHNEAKR